MITITVILTIFLTMALVAAPLTAFAELDVQVYEGDGAVGIIVSEINSGFDVILDGNSTVTVTGTNASDTSGAVGEVIIDGAGSTNNTTTTTDVGGNATEESKPSVIELGHIGNHIVY